MELHWLYNMLFNIDGNFSISGSGFSINEVSYDNPGYIIPANAIILYEGADPKLPGWDPYTAADNKYIKGTVTEARIAATTAAAGNVSANLLFATAGDHAGGGSFLNTWFAYPGTFGSTQALTSAPAGGHTHTATIPVRPVANALPWTSTITLLAATTTHQLFPENTLHIKDIGLPGWHQKLATNPGTPTFNTIRNIRGGPASVRPTEPVIISANLAIVSTSTDGTHDHYVADTAYRNPATGTSLGGSSYNPPSPTFSGSQSISPTSQLHNHAVNSSFNVRNLQSKALKLWRAAQAAGPLPNTMIMYAGIISALPSYWKICDGTNGTIDMSNVYLSHSSLTATAHGTSFSKATSFTSTALVETWTHNHSYGTGSAGNGGIASQPYQHTSTSVPHSHELGSVTNMTETYEPNTIELAFIQFIPA